MVVADKLREEFALFVEKKILNQAPGYIICHRKHSNEKSALSHLRLRKVLQETRASKEIHQVTYIR